ncbi:bifunctional phosphoribosylaminoimidazolecarboxamide formyltransferase/IMP cyclohydrolase [Erythrobacter sp. SD-21]|nr:bifunctional phosphoribosylaminoimidazolecarboxamide formyltransferase/IMP cyclohydrolase [Erythrobacter sp. SD-21]
MNLFSPDLYRNFGIGFLAGTFVIAFSNGTEIVSAIAAVL